MRTLVPFWTLALAVVLLSGASPARPLAEDCGALRQSYAEALAAAQVCTPDAPDQCQATRPAALDDPCHCQVSVETARAAELDALLASYRERACPAAAGLCNRRCVAPAGRCLARPGESARCG